MSNEFQNLVAGEALEIPTYSIKRLKDGDTITVKALGEPYNKPDIDQKTGEQKTDKRTGKPAELTLMHVVDSHGVEGAMVLPCVVKNAIEQASKKGPITGRYFRMRKIKSEANKTTSWRVDEMIPAKNGGK